jgi:hypothetical protein
MTSGLLAASINRYLASGVREKVAGTATGHFETPRSDSSRYAVCRFGLPRTFRSNPAIIDCVNHLARMHLLVDAAAGRLNPAYVKRMINEEAILQVAFPEYRSRLYCEYIFSDPHNLSRFFQGSNAPWLARRSMDRVQLT